VFLITSSASNSRVPYLHRQHCDVLPVRSVRDFKSIHRRRRASNQECVACTSTLRRTDNGACPNLKQGGLLQFASRQNVHSTDDRLQSVLNAAARLIFTARRTDHISPLLRDLHGLCVPEHVKFKLCVLMYRCWHGMAQPYLADNLSLTSADGNRRHLRYADSPTLVVRPTRCSTLGDRAFLVAAANVLNSLPPALRDAPSLLSFRSHLKT